MNQYTIVWRDPNDKRKKLTTSGPFSTESAALSFIYINQPCLVEAIRVEERKQANG